MLSALELYRQGDSSKFEFLAVSTCPPKMAGKARSKLSCGLSCPEARVYVRCGRRLQFQFRVNRIDLRFLDAQSLKRLALTRKSNGSQQQRHWIVLKG